MFYLMCKDIECVEFDLSDDPSETKVSNIKVVGKLPIGCAVEMFPQWLQGRHASRHRKHLTAYLQKLGIYNLKGFLLLTHGISINDCYWIKEEKEDLKWREVSPYSNDYDEIVQRLAFDGVGLYGEKLSSVTPEFGASGNFEKCWIKEDSGIYMLKRGSEGASNAGLEPFCEVLASQVFFAMKAGIPYKLVTYHDKVASKCRLFNSEDKSFGAYRNLYTDCSFYGMLQYYDSLGTDLFRRIVVCDALTLNTDRHAGNHGIFYDASSLSIIAEAPGYDYNLSLCPYLTKDDFAFFDEKYYELTPKIGGSFIVSAREVLTPAIRRDLINLKGIKLTLPEYTDKFDEERCEWLSTLVNTQIDNILSTDNIKVPTFDISNLSNCAKYRKKFNFREEYWMQHEIPRLMKVLGVQHMDELEKEIAKFL